MRMVDSDLRCRDCRVDTDAIDECHTVTDPIWDQATHGEIDGHLCTSAASNTASGAPPNNSTPRR